MWKKNSTWLQYLVAVCGGVIYGILGRITFSYRPSIVVSERAAYASGIMLIAFLFLVPLSLGALVVIGAPKARRTWKFVVFAPWLACLLTLIVSSLTNLEGSICIVFMAPILFVLSSGGAVIAHQILRRREGRQRLLVAAGFVLLPYVVAPFESLVDVLSEKRIVENDILIHASPKIVWDHVKTVDEIEPAEQRFAWSYIIGFPKPISATLSHEGIGGVRQATFERDVRFVESIDRWEEGRLLSFSIAAQPIPDTSLDEHVKIGGKYFDVLNGTYEILPQPDGTTLVKLSSVHRLSTHFNRYAAIWSDWVMSDIQTSILKVIQARCEAQG